ncbi:MAG TPA: Panacea domain-containing protein [Thermoanaerobaculia bacterium]|nr:Panacea domain-containing protein [Thermoanaerobaculia bacterium]
MARSIRGEPLNPKLEAVLAQLCRKLGAMTTTRAVKLPYLVDVVATHYLGAPITEGTHETWDHGVVTREVWTYIQQGGEINGPFVIRDHNYSETGKQISVAGEPEEDLTPEEEAIVDRVAEAYGGLDAASLGKLTKSLNTQFEARVWGKNQKALVDEDAFARLSDSYQSLYGRLPHLDFSDEKDWGEPITDPHEYLRRKLGG